MGVGGSHFIHNAYNFYQKPEVQFTIQTIRLVNETEKMIDLLASNFCCSCGMQFRPSFRTQKYCVKCQINYPSLCFNK